MKTKMLPCGISVHVNSNVSLYSHLSELSVAEVHLLFSYSEPFDLSNTARSVFDQNTFRRIFFVIRRSWEILKTTRNIDKIIKEPV